jgi:hypothetical protein
MKSKTGAALSIYRCGFQALKTLFAPNQEKKTDVVHMYICLLNRFDFVTESVEANVILESLGIVEVLGSNDLSLDEKQVIFKATHWIKEVYKKCLFTSALSEHDEDRVLSFFGIIEEIDPKAA